MTNKHIIHSTLLAVSIVAASAHASDDPFAGKTYQEGFDAGISYAISALAYKTYGMADTPYPVEMPSRSGWDKTVNTKIAIHACVRAHIEKDLAKAGGATNMGYQNITNIAKRVLAYCGAERTEAP